MAKASVSKLVPKVPGVAGATRRAAYSASTKRALVDVAEKLFAEKGYAATSLDAIVAGARVTKGALYHHFPGGKTDLFRAVLAEAQEEIGRRVAAAADAEDDPWAQLTAGCREFLVAATAPEIQRIVLVDGPAVLGWSEWRAMDEAASARHLAEALISLVEAGIIAAQPVQPLVHLLSGAMNEAALWLASSSRPEDLTDTVAALQRMLQALRAD